MIKRETKQPATDAARLQHTLEQLERRLSTQTRWRPTLMRAFFTGIFTALGAMAAVAVVVPMLVWMLRGVHWPPLLDTIIEPVIQRVEQNQQQHRPSSAASSSVSSSSSSSSSR